MRQTSHSSSNFRRPLIEHVERVQKNVRSCSGCGLCCTEAYNAQRILRIEATDIADHLATLPARRRDALLHRVDAVIARYRLAKAHEARLYTCPFLEPDFTCALPFHVKPLACLTFNPTTKDSCDQESKRFDLALPALEAANRAAGHDGKLAPIPVAVKAAWRARSANEPRAKKASGRGEG